MALDRVRNEAYAAALRRVITPDSVVLDLGAGTGVLGLIAARLGARRVYLVEPTDVIVAVRGNRRRQRSPGLVQCAARKLEDVVIPEQVDVIVSVMTGNFLLTEDLLPVLFRARDTLLEPGGHLVPDAAVMEAVLVSAAAGLRARTWRAGPHRSTASTWPRRGPTLRTGSSTARRTSGDARYLCEPADLPGTRLHAAPPTRPLHAQVDLRRDRVRRVPRSRRLVSHAAGRRVAVHVAAVPQLHWSSAYLPIDPPMHV